MALIEASYINHIVINGKQYDNPLRIKTLKLSSMGIRHIEGDKLKYFPNVEQLILYENRLTEIPDEIKYLKRLRIINVANNYITKITKHICDLSHLKEINITHNCLNEDSFPIGFFKMKSLRSLYMNGNPYTSLKKIKLHHNITRKPHNFIDGDTKNTFEYITYSGCNISFNLTANQKQNMDIYSKEYYEKVYTRTNPTIKLDSPVSAYESNKIDNKHNDYILNIKVLVSLPINKIYIIETNKGGICMYRSSNKNIYQLDYYNSNTDYKIKYWSNPIGIVHNNKLMFFEGCSPLYSSEETPYKSISPKNNVKAELRYIVTMNKEIQNYRDRINELHNTKSILIAQNKKQRETIKKLSNDLFNREQNTTKTDVSSNIKYIEVVDDLGISTNKISKHKYIFDI
jgi:hypothetical protein